MSTSTGSINPQMLSYLGPRMDAVHAAVAAADLAALEQSWPLAERALFVQGVDTGDLMFPAGEVGMVHFKRHILTRVRPDFTSILGGILELTPQQRHIAMRREMIELGAMATFAECGLIEQAVREQFASLQRLLMDGDATFDAALMDDVAFLNEFLARPTSRDPEMSRIEDLLKQYTDVDTEDMLGYYYQLMDDLSHIGPDWVLRRPGAYTCNDKRYRHAYLKVMGILSDKIVIHRAMLLDILQPGIEKRLTQEVIDDFSCISQDELASLYEGGFISRPLYLMLERYIRPQE